MTVASLALVFACGPEADEQAFLAMHWQRPVPPQGPPPQSWAAITIDLDPQACGTCHVTQLRDWSTSLHAGAYSAGLEGQLLPLLESDPATANSCMECHGPLSEQLARVADADGSWLENPVREPGLERQGVVCAACHVRGWKRYGPLRRDGSVQPPPPGTPHEGAIRRAEFGDGRFCGACHQFEEPAPNGKPLENTVREWEASGYAKRGVGCQTCHMPDRRHLWRGIHDPEMTRSGVTPEWRIEGRPDDATFRVRLGLTNTGTGHFFPTYVTPAVDLELAFLGAGGDTVAVRRRVLERDVHFDGSGWVERKDDRIPPTESRRLEWAEAAPAGAARVVGRVVVRPDAFYRDFFVDLLADSSSSPASRALLQKALDRTKRSPYELWSWEEPLRPDPPRLPEDRIRGDEFVVATVRPRCLERCEPGDVLRHLPMQLRTGRLVCDLRLGLRIDTEGRVRETRILNPSDHPACDRAVEEWGATTRWTAAYNRDVPVEVWIALPVEVRAE